MTRKTVYTIFLSRPSDVEAEVEVVKQAINDANYLCGPLAIQFDVFDWRENATPGLGSEPQSRIDIQSEGYDALIAVLGGSLGTPTTRHPSGCVGEIEDAIDRAAISIFDNDSVMIFFKDVTLDLSSNLSEAQRVKDLKEGLGPRGVLWRPFSDDESLRTAVFRSLGVLIAKHVHGIPRDLITSQGFDLSKGQEVDDVSAVVLINDEDVGLGILDYGQIAQDELESVTELSHSIAGSMKILGDITSQQTQMLVDANARGDTSTAKEIMSVIAEAMDVCSDTLDRDGASMSASFGKSIEAIRQILELQIEDLDRSVSVSELSIAEQMTRELGETIDEVIPQLSGFRDSVATIPRLTKNIRSSKQRLLRASENLIASFAKISQENTAILQYSISAIDQ